MEISKNLLKTIILIESILIILLTGVFLFEDTIKILLSLGQFIFNRSGTAELNIQDNLHYFNKIFNFEFILSFISKILFFMTGGFGFYVFGKLDEENPKSRKILSTFLIGSSILSIAFYLGISKAIVFFDYVAFILILIPITNIALFSYLIFKKKNKIPKPKS